MVDIIRDVEDAAAAAHTELENSHRYHTVAVQDLIATRYGLREDLRTSKKQDVSFQSELKTIWYNHTRASDVLKSYKA